MSDADVGAIVGVSGQAIASYRKKHGIPTYGGPPKPRSRKAKTTARKEPSAGSTASAVATPAKPALGAPRPAPQAQQLWEVLGADGLVLGYAVGAGVVEAGAVATRGRAVVVGLRLVGTML